MSALPPLTKLEMDDPEAWILQERRKIILPLAWRKILQGLKEKPFTALGVRCAQIALDHLDPVAKPSVTATIHGPVVLTWASSPSPIPIAHSRESSTTPGDDNGHGPQSSSVTDSLESL